MTRGWMRYAILRAASLLTPREQRAEWLREWQSELWYIPRRGSARFCMGAFPDALWVRRAAPAAETGGMHLESPLVCLAFLAVVAAMNLGFALYLPAPRLPGMPAHFSVRELPAACLAMTLLSSLMLLAVRLVIGPNRQAMPRQGRLRRGLFLALKIALLHPILLAGFLAGNRIAPIVPLALPLLVGLWLWALRWALLDQRERCPVCLRLLTDPARIGTASQTLFEWYGTEWLCSRGHGMLHSPETSASHCGEPHWLRLDSCGECLLASVAKERR